MSIADVSFSTVFGQALRGTPCVVVGLDAAPRPIPVQMWTGGADATDHRLLSLCHGPTLDIGCGPGRMAAALAELGQVCLGIDVVGEAVQQTVERGVAALHRSVFDALPGEGRWSTALLADGNVGIGGDPLALLQRVRQLIDPRGSVVVEVEAPDAPLDVVWARLECEGIRSRPFRWARLGGDALAAIASEVGLSVTERHSWGDRHAVVLQEAT